MMLPPALARLARLHGVQLSYVDGLGSVRDATEDQVIAVLGALGVELSGDIAASAEARLWEEEQRRLERAVPRCVVCTAGRGAQAVSVRHHSPGASFELRVVGEDGAMRTASGQFTSASAGEEPGTVCAPLPDDLAPGYYQCTVEAGGQQAEFFLIVAPERAYQPESLKPGAWGVFAPVYSLRSDRNGGIGDLGDLRELARWTHRLGGGVVGTLPLLAGFFDNSNDVSPYSPVSRLFWNELYLDFDALAQAVPAPAARERLADSARLREVERLRSTPLVEYGDQIALTRQLLSLFSDWAWGQSSMKERLERYAAADPERDAYARFRAEVEATGTRFHDWPEKKRAGDLGVQPRDRETPRRYHLFAQWALEQQLTALGAAGTGLYLDLPVGAHREGFDAWRFQESFAGGVSVGAPPDALYEGGQNWSLPALHPGRLRETSYRYWIASVRNHMRFADLLRIDHVMGMHRLYWIPEGAAADEGLYVEYSAEEQYAVLLVESHKNRCAIAGEDLGTVPEPVRPAMSARGIARLHVHQFDPEGRVPAGAVASLGTHDTATFAQHVATWESEQPTEKLLAEALERLAVSEAGVVLVTLEDLWLEESPQNVPGPSGRPENWRQKLRYRLDELCENDRVLELLRLVAEGRKRAEAVGVSRAQ